MLTIGNLTVCYRGAEALSSISLELNEGEMVSIIGRNGAGKSTLLRAITGLVPADSGEIWYQDKRIDGMAPHKIVGLGIACVPEGRRIFQRMSVRENLQLGATVQKNKSAIGEALDLIFGIFPILKERLKQQAGTLSGGEQQMLAIARALMSQPKCLLTDELSMGLAPLITQEIGNKLVEISQKQRVAILIVEQNANMALGISQRSYLLNAGQIVLSGEAKEMANNEDVKKIYLGET
ncbi:MAG: ABC transporter ATP-binding protein, partial [Candidatus Hodarchaeota archaeon]